MVAGQTPSGLPHSHIPSPARGSERNSGPIWILDETTVNHRLPSTSGWTFRPVNGRLSLE